MKKTLTALPTSLRFPVLLPALLIAGLGTQGIAAAVSAAQSTQTVKEGESGHKYPAKIQSTLKSQPKVADAAATPGAPEAPKAKPLPMSLTGLAIREKTVFNVNVYSYVLYVDDNTLKEDFSQWKGQSLSKVEKDKALFRSLLSQKGTKELRIRFCRDVDSDDVVEAFEDYLKPGILRIRKSEKGTDAAKLKELATFRKFFSLDELEDGNELRFTWHPDGTLSSFVNGERKADLKAPALCQALFEVYLGSDPISKSGKKKLVKRLPALLK